MTETFPSRYSADFMDSLLTKGSLGVALTAGGEVLESQMRLVNGHDGRDGGAGDVFGDTATKFLNLLAKV